MAEENKEPLEEKEPQPQEEAQASEEVKEGEQAQTSEAEGSESAEEIAPEDLMAMWEDALKEAGQATESKESAEAQPSEQSKKEADSTQTQPAKLEELSPEVSSGPPPELDFILDIPLQVSVEIGRTKMLIKELLKLNQGSIIELEKFAGEPVEVYVNGKLMAKGEVIVVNDKFGVRITEIISAQERVKRLGS